MYRLFIRRNNKIRKYFKPNDNEDISNKKEIDKAVQSGKFILLNIYIRKGERLIINNPNFHLKITGKKREN